GAVVKQTILLLTVLIYVLKVAHNLLDGGEVGEGTRIAADDAFKLQNLPLVDDAQKNGGVRAGVHAFALDAGCAVPQAVDQFLGNFIRLLGDDFKLNGGFSAAQDAV